MAKKERTPEEMIRQFCPELAEPMIHTLRMAQDGGGEFAPDQEVELLKIAKMFLAVGAAMETGPKDRWYDTYIGSITDKTQLVRGCKITVVAPSEPKTTTTPAHYAANLDKIMELAPPHEFPEFYDLIPAATETTVPKKRGHVSVEILDEAYAVAATPTPKPKAKRKPRRDPNAADVAAVTQAEIDDLFPGGGDTAEKVAAF